MIAAAASCGCGHGETVRKIGSHFGFSCMLGTFLKHVRPLGLLMNETVSKLVCGEAWLCAAMDNNQKGHPLNFQRYGSSNKFFKVTGRVLYQCV